MPEILTESFCERCGTRYTFESSQPRTARLKGIKVMSRGLKNFVLSDDASLDEAMAAARSDTDREVTSQQLDAFHKTFNFCMSCRQYTCGNCWNEAEGRCLSCAPHLGQEIMPAPFPNLPADGGTSELHVDGNGASPTNGHSHEPAAATDAFADTELSWPTSDLMRDADLPDEADQGGLSDLEPIDAAARLAFLDGLTSTPAEAADAAAASESRIDDTPSSVSEPPAAPEPEVVAATALPVDAPAEPVAADPEHRAAAAAAQTSAMLQRFRPGQSLDDAIAEYEQSQVDAAATAADVRDDEGAPIAAAAVAASLAVTPEPVLEPEPVAAAPVAEPEREDTHVAELLVAAAAVERQPEPEAMAAEPETHEPESPAAERREDLVEQPVWRIVAPDPSPAAPLAPADAPADQPAANGEPQWPAQPEWPSQRPSAGGLPFLDRPPVADGGMEALWAESARAVTGGESAATESSRILGGVQPCVSCGLSLSATARFCRRCGSAQG